MGLPWEGLVTNMSSFLSFQPFPEPDLFLLVRAAIKRAPALSTWDSSHDESVQTPVLAVHSPSIYPSIPQSPRVLVLFCPVPSLCGGRSSAVPSEQGLLLVLTHCTGSLLVLIQSYCERFQREGEGTWGCTDKN